MGLELNPVAVLSEVWLMHPYGPYLVIATLVSTLPAFILALWAASEMAMRVVTTHENLVLPKIEITGGTRRRIASWTVRVWIAAVAVFWLTNVAVASIYEPDTEADVFYRFAETATQNRAGGGYALYVEFGANRGVVDAFTIGVVFDTQYIYQDLYPCTPEAPSQRTPIPIVSEYVSPEPPAFSARLFSPRLARDQSVCLYVEADSPISIRQDTVIITK